MIPQVPFRVLHITGRSDTGGGPAHVHDLVSGLADLGIECWIACPRRGVWAPRFDALVGGGRVLPIPHRVFDPWALESLVMAHRQVGFALVHSHGMAAGFYGRLLSARSGVPCVHSFHGVPRTVTAKHLAYRLLVEPGLARWTRRAVAVSPGELAEVESRYPAYRGRMEVVPNAIDLPASAPIPRPADPVLRIVTFTRANTQKNPRLLCDIAGRLRAAGQPVHIDAYGEGMESVPWRSEAACLGVMLHGPTADPIGALRQAEAYLSTSRWEGMPLSLLEAFAHGALVVASAVVGNADVVEDGRTGLLYPEGDAEAAAAALLRLVREPGLGCRLREQAWHQARTHHARQVMAERMLTCYRRALAS